MDQCDMCGQPMCETCEGCGCMGNECSCNKDDAAGGDEDDGLDEEGL